MSKEPNHQPAAEPLDDFLSRFVPGVEGDEEMQFSKFQPYPDGVGTRYEFGDINSSGYQDVIRFSDDLFMVVNDQSVLKQFYERTQGSSWNVLHFRLAGDTREYYPGLGEVRRQPEKYYFETLPEGEQRLRGVEDQNRLCSVAIAFGPNVIADIVDDPFVKLPDGLKSHLLGEVSDVLSVEVSSTPGIRRALCDVVATGLVGSLRRQYLQGKSFELLSLAVDQISEHSSGTGIPVRLTTADRSKIHDARDILANNIANPPSIDALSREIGLNRKKLKYGFKHLFGVTISEFCLKQRIQFSLELLRQGDLSITEISYQAGYASPSSLTTACRREFGLPPKALRARGR